MGAINSHSYTRERFSYYFFESTLKDTLTNKKWRRFVIITLILELYDDENPGPFNRGVPLPSRDLNIALSRQETEENSHEAFRYCLYFIVNIKLLQIWQMI